MKRKADKKKLLAQFIKKRPWLIWWARDKKKIGEEVILEVTLNYGDWDDVEELFKIIGLSKAAKIFRKQISYSSGRCNYRDNIRHYFTLYFYF